MKTSQAGIDLIKTFEGLRLDSYLCSSSIPTIGYGHTGPDVSLGMRITGQKAEILLRQDLDRFEKAVEKLITVELSQNQFDALVSFAFNVGTGALGESSLRRRLNAGENPNTVATQELPRWNKGSNGPLEGLTRRRLAEVDLFCQNAPTPKTGMIDITSKQQTLLKKLPVQSGELTNEQKAKVYQGRTIKGCTVLEKKDGHTYLELGFGMGKWWIFDAHWDGLTTEIGVAVYAETGGERSLRNFPYFYQQDNGPEGWRQCQTSSLAMCLKYLDVPGIKDDLDYLKLVKKYGDTTHRAPHHSAMRDLGMAATFTTTANADDIKEQIDQGQPVAAGILHHGTVSAPSGGGHFIVISGYGPDYWLVQDPYGDLDLVNGVWSNTGPTAGKNRKYSFKNMNPRLFVSGGSDGWCWLNFKKI